MTMEQKISKLPKWVQNHINDLERQRDVAVRELNAYVNTQTSSPFYIDDLVCTGEKNNGPSTKRRYIQSSRMDVEFRGVHLTIVLRPQDRGMWLSYGSIDNLTGVGIVPVAANCFELVNKLEMR